MEKKFRYNELELVFESEPQKGMILKTEIEHSDCGLVIKNILENTSGEDIQLFEVPLFKEISVEYKYEKTYSECRDLLGELGINDADTIRSSYNILGYTDKKGTKALLFGFNDLSKHFYKFVSRPIERGYNAEIYCDFQGAYIAKGSKAVVSDLYIYFSDSVSALLEKHAQNILKKMPIKKPVKNTFGTGWCSWYYYYGTENKENIYENMEELKTSEIGKEMGFILIDDGWNQKENDVCVWGDWTAGCKFPEGMKAVCDKIHSYGLKAGIWLAPFAVSRKSDLFKAHPEWILGGKEDILNPNEGVFGLDLTNPEVLSYLKEVFTRVFDEWGYDIVKIDFLLYGAGQANRKDKYSTGVQAFRKGLEVIRECAGEKIVLNCGSPVLQSIGLCDVMRIGSDVGSRWYFPLNEGGWPYGNCSIKCSTRYTIYRNWMNYAFWLNDPDCIVVREKSNKIEQKQFCSFFPYMQIEEKDFGLSENEALLWIKMVAFTGGIKYLSEKWGDLSENRKELVAKYARKKYGACKLVDYYEYHDLYILESKDGKRVAVFNVSDEDIKLNIPLSKLEGADALTETESGEKIVKDGAEWKFPIIKARSGYIFE